MGGVGRPTSPADGEVPRDDVTVQPVRRGILLGDSQLLAGLLLVYRPGERFITERPGCERPPGVTSGVTVRRETGASVPEYSENKDLEDMRF
ncbi:hypothetical protein EYF80_020997 [Liparis tanakae]|uniref:Uncharacterized protein n=1 Tax=Liparis tanakae TaxID=230148 RepID=A0A4Z2HSN8_9TELE|nr:hypothetical protein EYF80_020997 [Liparis tanakae]